MTTFVQHLGAVDAVAENVAWSKRDLPADRRLVLRRPGLKLGSGMVFEDVAEAIDRQTGLMENPATSGRDAATGVLTRAASMLNATSLTDR